MVKTISLFGGAQWMEVTLSEPVNYYWDFDDPQNFSGDGPHPGTYLFSNGSTGPVGRVADNVSAQVKADRANWAIKWNQQQLALGLATPEVATRFVVGPGAGAGGVGIEGAEPASHFVTFAGQLRQPPERDHDAPDPDAGLHAISRGSSSMDGRRSDKSRLQFVAIAGSRVSLISREPRSQRHSSGQIA